MSSAIELLKLLELEKKFVVFSASVGVDVVLCVVLSVVVDVVVVALNNKS